jgi:hypothetical protein
MWELALAQLLWPYVVKYASLMAYPSNGILSRSLSGTKKGHFRMKTSLFQVRFEREINEESFSDFCCHITVKHVRFYGPALKKGIWPDKRQGMILAF